MDKDEQWISINLQIDVEYENLERMEDTHFWSQPGITVFLKPNPTETNWLVAGGAGWPSVMAFGDERSTSANRRKLTLDTFELQGK